ncbi:MAG TPA: diguanylate cyclase [Thermoleophilaceae bacterium]|nr:diguanylate cyclase [Thermoleophilaceae bacterium]
MPASELAILARLGAMFERTAGVRDESDLQAVLEEVCRTIAELLGYGAVVVNVYRPAFDDMLTAAAVGSEDASRHLVGRTSPADTWYPLLAERFERRGAYFVAAEEFDWEEFGVETFVPKLAPTDDPDAWKAEDALFVPLRDARGGLIGMVSVDEPETGRRPGDEELDALVAVAGHAALALRIAQATANDVQHQNMLEGVLEVSGRLAEADETEEVLQAVCDGIHDALRFDKVAIERAPAAGAPLTPVATSGWELDAEAVNHGMTLEALAPLFTEEFEVAGCYLLPAHVAEQRIGAHSINFRSEMNGRGPHAWARHWLLVPLEEQDGRRLGLIWVDDPRDRLLPNRARLQALRLFANQAVAALQSADQAAELRHEARHDALTGLPNRRAFLARLAGEAAHPDGTFALILCDMDNLKALNDTYGHEAGDLALRLLADALRTGLRRSDDAFRIGGDEFAVVLGGASRLDAERVARRLEYAISRAARAPFDSIDASLGIAVHEPGEDPDRLVARADQALYGTKRRRRRESVA